MVIIRLTERMGSVPDLPIKQSDSIGTMLNFDEDGQGYDDGTCKPALRTLLHRTTSLPRPLSANTFQANENWLSRALLSVRDSPFDAII